MNLYPLMLKPRIYPRVWGGQRLQELFAPDLDFAPPLGEVWAVHGELAIVNGEYSGRTLDELWREFPSEMGASKRSGNCFPLLIKWLDTNDWLSLQVHPDDKQARIIEKRDDVSGKIECWYVIEVSGDGELICGCNAEGGAESLATLSGRELLPYLHRQKVVPGDFLFVPAGTIHALGPGISVLEVQQRSDITYRFYDWERPGVDGVDRPLHLCQARQAWLNSHRMEKHCGAPPRVSLGELLTANVYFTQELVKGSGSWQWSCEGLEIIIAIAGSLNIKLGGTDVSIPPGRMVILPAAAEHVSVSASEKVQFIRVICPTKIEDE